MVYHVTFGADDADKFALLYQAFVIGGNNASDKKNIEVLRREIAIMDAFDAISRDHGDSRVMLDGPQSLTLDQPQFHLVKRYLDAFVGVTSTAGARRVVALVDWFDRIVGADPAK